MIDIIKDVAILTTIPEKSLRKLVDKTIYSINEAVVEARITNQDMVELDVGIGVLRIQLDSDMIRYKFTPGQELESSVKIAFIDKQNLLEDALDASLVNKLTNIYKDIL